MKTESSAAFLTTHHSVQQGLLAVILVRNSELLTAMSTTRSKYATTILGLHTLAETMLVNATTVVWLECSFHCFILVFIDFSTIRDAKVHNLF